MQRPLQLDLWTLIKVLGSIQSLFTGDIQAKSCIPSSFQPPDIGKNLGGVFLFSEFLVKFLINKNCHNSTTSNYIDMKVRPLTKYDKRNTKFKKIDDYVVLILYCYFSNLWSSLEQSKNRIPATIFVKKF